MTEELIREARDMTLYARTTKHGAVSHADMIDKLADALEAATTEWEYGKKRAYVDGWERGDNLGDGYYIERCDEGEADMIRRKAGPWLPVEGEAE